MRMTSKEKWEKRNWLLFLVGYFAIGYVIINWINEGRSHYFNVALPGESEIPYVSVFIFGYLFVYISILILYFLVDDVDVWRRAVLSYLVLTTLCYIVFLAFPVKVVDRPEVAGMIMHTWVDQVARAYFVLDRPYNALPSIHASYPTLATLLIWRSRPVWRYIFLGMTITICVSVIMVKQHYVMDVITGVAAAFASYYAVRATRRLWHPWFERTA